MSCRRRSKKKSESRGRILKPFISYFLLSMLIFPMGVRAEGLSVITTIFPLKEFTQEVGGDLVNIYLLLPPGAEPHTWEPKPSDILKLQHADVFVYIGDEMEPWVRGVLKTLDNPKLHVIEVSHDQPFAGINNVHRHHEDSTKEGLTYSGVDPHIWLNFEYDQEIVDRIADALSNKDPEGAQYYRRNAEAYKERLKNLDLKYKKGLDNCKCNAFILGGHAAFFHLAKRYQLTQISLYGVSPNSEPTPKKMVKVITLAKKHQVGAIYFEELVNDRLARVIAEEVGVITLLLHPGANLTKTQIESGTTFLSLMEENLENLKYGLICQ